MSFRIIDFRDTDLMAQLLKLGEVSAPELAGELGASNGVKGTVISSRLAWMKRYGMVTFDPKKHTWAVSEGGARVLESQRLAATKKMVEALPREELIEVMAHITSIYRLGDPLLAAMLRREFQYGTAPDSAAWRR